MSDAHGFTLLEVLVALITLLLGLAGFYRILGDGFLVNNRTTCDRNAAMFVDNIVAELGRSRPLKIGRTTGTLPDGQIWTLQIESYLPHPIISSAPVLKGFVVQIEVGKLPYRFNTLMLGF